ncbi:hypothetical protein SLNSH_16250 [Alsobacter soli]|uniref:HTH HARE-type domain-containing protein n=1 Tax=Alsobacter soli TaxID=2109933 RepID=A0A2T1HQQ4_9HYPH|nr:hypothetical protein [Alsobacter soli]PSC03983.1 hypothetical protein SLNSH_16250 [Alsobacter soli]
MVETSLETLKSLWEDLHTRLKAQSADYRTLLALDSAIRSMEAASGGSGGSEAPPPAPAGRGSAIDLAVRVTQAEAAQRVLEARGEPMPIDELIRLVPAFGGRPGTRASLSSSLSQAPQFVSIRHANRWCWWLADRPIGPEPEQGQRAGRTPSRSQRWRQISRVPRRRGRGE